MAKPKDPRSALDALMAEVGVTPLDDRADETGPTRRNGPSPPGRAASPSVADLQDERDALRTERDELRGQLSEARDALRSARRRGEELEDDLAERERALAKAEHARDEYDHERRVLARRITSLQEQAPAPDPPRPLHLRELLADRGLEEAEHVRALGALLEARPRRLMEALSQVGGAALRDLLDERLVLTCSSAPCQPAGAATAAVQVPRARCEFCGGSDAGRAFQRFARACARKGLDRVIVVGGSPAYRRVLRDLSDATDQAPRLDLIDGRNKQPARRVKSSARTADLVVVWCSTILDHATSAAFDASDARLLHVPHRGIATMLRYVADALE